MTRLNNITSHILDILSFFIIYHSKDKKQPKSHYKLVTLNLRESKTCQQRNVLQTRIIHCAEV